MQGRALRHLLVDAAVSEGVFQCLHCFTASFQCSFTVHKIHIFGREKNDMKVLKAVVNVLAWVVLILALLITIIVFSSERNNGVANLMGFIPENNSALNRKFVMQAKL